MCKRLREAQQRESALIVEVNEQARLLGVSAERECDLRGDLQNRRDLFKLQEHLMSELQDQLAAERDLADRLADALKGIWPFIEEDIPHGCNSTGYRTAIELCRENITAWKEARSEKC